MPARLSDLPRLLAASDLKPVWLIAGSEHLLAIEARAAVFSVDGQTQRIALP